MNSTWIRRRLHWVVLRPIEKRRGKERKNGEKEGKREKNGKNGEKK